MILAETFCNEGLSVCIDGEIASLSQEYLANRKDDLTRIPDAILRGDFKTIRITGHNMAGTGAAFGFQAITTIGRKLEAAAVAQDSEVINECVCALKFFVEHVEVKYV